MKKLLFFFLIVPVFCEAQNSFTKNDFTNLCTSSLLGMKYQMDSIIYEHGFRAVSHNYTSKPYLFYYEHEQKEGVALVVYYNTDDKLLNVLIHSKDYEYYKGLRNLLTAKLEVTESDVDFYGYNCRFLSSGLGSFVDGIKTENNQYLVGWIMSANGWDSMYGSKE